jgi:uncharacterized membrane protein
MNNSIRSWESAFTLDSAILLKVVAFLLLALWIHGILRRRKNLLKRRFLVGAIAEANARERHQWRYFHRALLVLKIACSVYFMGTLIKYLFT